MWAADPGALEHLRNIFKATLSSNKDERSQAVDALNQAREQAEFENYLVDLLIRSDAGSDVKAAAGLNLKNAVLKEPRKDRPYVLDQIMNGLLLDDTMARNITGTVITSLFSLYGLEKWPQSLNHLLQLVEAPEVAQLTKEAAMGALSKICEDSAYSLNKEFNGERPLNYMVPKFIKIAAQPEASSSTKAKALGCLNLFIPLKTQLFLVLIDDFLQVLFLLASDPNTAVRKNVCTAFLLIMENRPDKLVPHMDGVVEYGLHSMQDEEEEVAMEACEFLLALAESPAKGHKEKFRPKLQKVLPVLLDKMVYLEEEVFLIQIADEKDNANVADKQDDIRPNAAKAKEHTVSRKNASSSKKESKAYEPTTYEDERVQDSDGSYVNEALSDSDDDDEDSDDELDAWNLRRCSAATLDALSLEYPQEVIQVTLPILQEKIVSTGWPVREAAILAFGAISTSCVELANDKLPTLVPFLVDRLKDLETRVRQISCWTVSRFAQWVADEAHEGGHYANYFQPTFESIVLCALDAKKIVQEAACSALSIFIETTDVSLISYYVRPLLEHFAKCLQTYQRKNMVVLYDCILTFVDKIGQDVFNSHPDYVSTLLPPLLQHWQALNDTDSDLWPLLECMAAVAATMGEAFAPYAVPVYERAVKILSNAVQMNQEVHTHPEIEAPEKDFIVTSLDLIDGLVQGFKGHSVDLMKQHGADLMEIVQLCLEDHDDDVRQLTYALLGDLAIHANEVILPNFYRIILMIGNELTDYSYVKYPVTSNAIWACGEMAITLPKETVHPQVWNISDLLITLLNSPDVQQSVLENAAICLGRFGFVGPEVLGPRLPEFIYSWCKHMMYVLENDEKESGILGIIEIILQNPDKGFGGLSNQQGRKNLAVFLDVIANYLNGSEKLMHRFHQFLIGYRDLTGPNWEQVLSLASSDTQLVLKSYR